MPEDQQINDQPTVESPIQDILEPVGYQGGDQTLTSQDLSTVEAPSVNNIHEPEVGRIANLTQPDELLIAANSTVAVEDTTLANNTQKVRKGIFKFVKPVIAISIGSILLLGGASYSAYAWYQNPQKVITDSIWGIITTKSLGVVGNIGLKTDENSKMSIDMSIKANSEVSGGDYHIKFTNADKSYSFNAGMVIKKTGDVYLKVADSDNIISDLKTTLGLPEDSNLIVAIDKFVKKIDGTWIKVTNSELKEYSEDASKSQQCLTDTIKKYENDKVAIAEIETLYNKNQFVIVDKDLGQKDGNFGYSVKVDEKVAKSFTEGLINTSIYKSLHECDDDFTIDLSDINDAMSVADDDSKVTGNLNLWINTWSHKIVKIETSIKSDTVSINSSIDIKYDEVSVSDPSSSMSVADLKSNIEELMTSYQDFVESYYNYDDTYFDCNSGFDCSYDYEN